MEEQLRQSPLVDSHVELGARLVPFAGWNMPVQYEGIIPENKAVRSNLGVFDISHMGQIVVASSAPAFSFDFGGIPSIPDPLRYAELFAR